MRGAGQVAHGKAVAVFVQGEYGIGKSSLAASDKVVISTSPVRVPALSPDGRTVAFVGLEPGARPNLDPRPWRT